MFEAERFRERLGALGLSQGQLARRIGVSQQTISRLASGERYGSRYLHRIARELGTTPAYLTGETDDPLADASPVPELAADEREIVAGLRVIDEADRRTFGRMVRAMAALAEAPIQRPLPEKRALAAMFRALLEALPPELTWDQQAELLAEWLPTSLDQLVDIVPEEDEAETHAPVLADQEQGPRS